MRNAVQRPNNNANPSQLSEKKSLLCAPAQKHPRSRCGTKKHSIWHYFLSNLAILKHAALSSGVELTPKSRKKLIGALSCMHKGPKCIQFLWDPPKRIPFVQKHKESALSAILREKPHFGAFPEAKKGVVKCTMLCRGPIIIQIPQGY